MRYVSRVRDLVHGFVYLTELEREVINHPLFQRLRHVRQNDVAFFVYPSLNISRFEHSLGCAHVAGKMADNLRRSAQWENYSHDVGLDSDDFIQSCRLYALLHDIGHLPLSHLFELAFEDYIFVREERIPDRQRYAEYCREWFGVQGFWKLHEACGAALSEKILGDVNIKTEVRETVRRLMQTKKLEHGNSLWPIKLLVDSEVDADRIDATARDGLLAGQEYGNYDIERLCSSVFVRKDGPRWRLAYSHKALGSIESLLLDRYRTHIWIHFHHCVVLMKVAAKYLLGQLLLRGERDGISKADFPVDDHQNMALRDDIWLWTKLRTITPSGTGESAARACLDAVLRRKKDRVTCVWKNRAEYLETIKELNSRLQKKALGDGINPTVLGREYQTWLSEKVGAQSVVHWLNFKAYEKHPPTPLTEEYGTSEHGDLTSSSQLITSLESVWFGEPQFYVVILGQKPDSREHRRRQWVDLTFEWIQNRASL